MESLMTETCPTLWSKCTQHAICVCVFCHMRCAIKNRTGSGGGGLVYHIVLYCHMYVHILDHMYARTSSSSSDCSSTQHNRDVFFLLLFRSLVSSCGRPGACHLICPRARRIHAREASNNNIIRAARALAQSPPPARPSRQSGAIIFAYTTHCTRTPGALKCMCIVCSVYFYSNASTCYIQYRVRHILRYHQTLNIFYHSQLNRHESLFTETNALKL